MKIIIFIIALCNINLAHGELSIKLFQAVEDLEKYNYYLDADCKSYKMKGNCEIYYNDEKWFAFFNGNIFGNKHKLEFIEGELYEDNIPIVTKSSTYFQEKDIRKLYEQGKQIINNRKFNEQVQHLGQRRSYPKWIWHKDTSN